MEASSKPARPTKLRLALQPALIRMYKGAGIVALGAILIGLVLFLVVNVFYFLDSSWVRPQILSPSHEKVIAAVSAEADAKLQRSQLEGALADARAELAGLDRAIAATDRFEADAAEEIAKPITTPEAALLRREVDRMRLDREAAGDRRAALQRQIDELAVRMAEQDKIVERLRASPYFKAADHRVTVAFVPYENLDEVRPGVALYGCAWGLVRCSQVGRVGQILDGEVTDFHPHDDSAMRGVLAEIELSEPDAAKDGVLFADGKPFWIF